MTKKRIASLNKIVLTRCGVYARTINKFLKYVCPPLTASKYMLLYVMSTKHALCSGCKSNNSYKYLHVLQKYAHVHVPLNVFHASLP